MTNTAASLGRLLPLGAVGLGRLVLDTSSPGQDFYEPPASLPRPQLEQAILDFSEVLSQSEGTSLHGDLTSMLSARATSQRGSGSLVSSLRCVSRQMLNSGEYFAELCRLPKARNFIERAARRRLPVFLVTCVESVTDATVLHAGGQQREVAVDAKVPVAAAAAAAGAPIPLLGDLVDPGAGRSVNRQVDAGSVMHVPGEQVYRAQYRKVEFAFFSRNKVDNSWLEKGNRWKAYVGLRGSGADAEDDCIEAVLSEVQEVGIQEVGDQGSGLKEEFNVSGVGVQEEADVQRG